MVATIILVTLSFVLGFMFGDLCSMVKTDTELKAIKAEVLFWKSISERQRLALKKNSYPPIPENELSLL